MRTLEDSCERPDECTVSDRCVHVPTFGDHPTLATVAHCDHVGQTHSVDATHAP